MAKKRRTLVLAYVTLALSMATMVGGSYALFTDQEQGKVHLEAGTLSATLTRTAHTARAYDPTVGYFVDKSASNESVDFTDNETDNVFGLEEGMLIVPTCTFSATMKISNDDVLPFDYYIGIVLAKEDANGATIDYSKMYLDDQIEVSISVENGTPITQRLTGDFTVGSAAAPISRLANGEAQSFTITVTFVDEAGNNDAQGETLDFDLVVYAVQNTESAPANNN